jgi:hypothetical protein
LFSLVETSSPKKSSKGATPKKSPAEKEKKKMRIGGISIVKHITYSLTWWRGISIYSQTCLKVGGSLYTVKPALRWRGISIYSQTCLKVEGGSLYTVKPA